MSEIKQLALKMAKPSNKDYEAFDILHDILTALLDHRVVPEEIESESPNEILDNNELVAVLGTRVQEWWDKHGGSWHRVVFGGKTAIENACDPNATTLEWKPEIEAAIKAVGVQL